MYLSSVNLSKKTLIVIYSRIIIILCDNAKKTRQLNLLFSNLYFSFTKTCLILYKQLIIIVLI